MGLSFSSFSFQDVLLPPLRGRSRTDNECLEFVQEGAIPPTALHFLAHGGKGFFQWKSLAVGPVSGERVINVSNLKYARGKWDLFAFQPVRVPGAVPLFMVAANNRQHMTKGSERGAYSLALDRVRSEERRVGKEAKRR